MRGVAAINGIAFAVALVASAAAGWFLRPASAREIRMLHASEATPTPAEDLIDLVGTPIPRREYRRIISASTVSNAILVEICEPDRVVAFGAYGERRSAQGFRYAGKPTIEHLEDLERVLAFHADLILVNGTADPRPVARLRKAGLVVFDLGETRGLSTLIPQIHAIAEVLGHPERGESFARALVEQMTAVAADVPSSARKRGMYLSVQGNTILGGAKATSYSDVLRAAGLLDAAWAYRNWPQYNAEQVLMMDPEVIVTNAGMRSRICGHPGLSMLSACKDPERIVEVDGSLLGDPGPSMIDAARVIRTALYGLPAPQPTMTGTGQ
jgi:iron complex transport system substrate-binding protein